MPTKFQTPSGPRPGYKLYDFETEPLPDEELLRYYGEFDRRDVKITKDLQKKGAEAVEAFLQQAEADYLPNLRENACKNPDTCRIVALGLVDAATGKTEIILGSEEEILQHYFAEYEALEPGENLVGWNNEGYDGKCAVKAAMRCNVPIPSDLIKTTLSGTQYLNKHIDLMNVMCGDRKSYLKLDRASFLLNGPRKNGSGADFAKNLASDIPEVRKGALLYLYNDNVMPIHVANRLISVGALDLAPAVLPPEMSLDNIETVITPARPRRNVAEIASSDDSPRKGCAFTTLVTGVQGDAVLEEFYGAFDENAVDVPKGVIKAGPDAIKEYIEKARFDYLVNMREKGAHNPFTSRVVGAAHTDLTTGKTEIVLGSEAEVVEDLFTRFQMAGPAAVTFGWGNSVGQDPHIFTAAVRSGVKLPPGFVQMSGGYRSFSRRIDLMQRYTGRKNSGDKLGYQDLSQASAANGGLKQDYALPSELAARLESGIVGDHPVALLALQREAAMAVTVLNSLSRVGLLDMPQCPEVQELDLANVEALVTEPKKRMPNIGEDDFDDILSPTDPEHDFNKARSAQRQVAAVAGISVGAR